MCTCSYVFLLISEKKKRNISKQKIGIVSLQMSIHGNEIEQKRLGISADFPS